MKLELQRNERIKEGGGYCANCGRPAHESPLWETMLDGDNKPVTIEVCKFFRLLNKEELGKNND
tara:strand:+ start:1137 stop:1328 length:192 start_codon:yes stop_codon:yes gene_type:complete